MKRGILAIIAVACCDILHGNAAIAATPAEQCEAAKLKASAGYAACRLIATRRALLRGISEDFSRCDSRYATVWSRVESRFQGLCPSSGDQSSVQAAVTALTNNLSSALGGSILDDCPSTRAVCDTQLASCDASLASCTADLQICKLSLIDALACGNAIIDSGEDCDQGNLNGTTCTSLGYASGTLACGNGCHFDAGGCIATPKLIFVTREIVTPGDNGPPLGFFTYPSRGDDICNRVAQNSPLTAGKLFKALICGREPDVADYADLGLRERVHDSVGGFVRTDGAPIADN